MAMRVPHECFYVRFGQYSNHIWLNALLEDYGGDIRSMISARGVRLGVNQRVQDQLAMEQGILAELLGPQAIADVAMIGMDTFTREGAAIGVIFEAKNRLLEVDLARQRQEALYRERDNGSSLVDRADRRPRRVVSLHARQPAAILLCDRWPLPTGDQFPPDRRAVSGGA